MNPGCPTFSQSVSQLTEIAWLTVTAGFNVFGNTLTLIFPRVKLRFLQLHRNVQYEIYKHGNNLSSYQTAHCTLHYQNSNVSHAWLFFHLSWINFIIHDSNMNWTVYSRCKDDVNTFKATLHPINTCGLAILWRTIVSYNFQWGAPPSKLIAPVLWKDKTIIFSLQCTYIKLLYQVVHSSTS